MKTLKFTIRIITILLLVLSFGVIGSCREQSKTEESTTETSINATQKLTKDNTSDTKGDVALNPAHGQPGHRCDLPVGARLDSKPANTTNNSQSGVPTNNSGEVKLNPAHGQPGHRCDIKVGDPL